jgi:hypothetical protein
MTALSIIRLITSMRWMIMLSAFVRAVVLCPRADMPPNEKRQNNIENRFIIKHFLPSFLYLSNWFPFIISNTM